MQLVVIWADLYCHFAVDFTHYNSSIIFYLYQKTQKNPMEKKKMSYDHEQTNTCRIAD